MQAVGALPTPPGDDAELISLCERVVDLERQWDEVSRQSGGWLPSDPRYKASRVELDRLSALQEPFIERIYDLPTHTLAGFRARARAIMASDYGQMHAESAYRGQLYSLMHDLVDEPGAGAETGS